MVACIDFFEMSEMCRPKFIVRHSTLHCAQKVRDIKVFVDADAALTGILFLSSRTIYRLRFNYVHGVCFS
jgi:hypothetical protein